MAAVDAALKPLAGRELIHLDQAAFVIGQLVAAGEFPRDWAESRLTIGAMVHSYPDMHNQSDIHAAIMAGLDAGAKYYRPKPANDNEPPLPIFDPTDWEGVPVKEREWFVPGLIPSRTVTLLSGDGGTGKSQLALQLVAASALGIDWLGLPVLEGACLFYTAEDEADELHKRLTCIVENAGRRLADLNGITLIPMVGRDPVLAIPDSKGQINLTAAYDRLRAEALASTPKLVVLDTAADVFGGNEIIRAQTVQFISRLRGLAIEIDCAVLLLSHPSLAGMASGKGTSGSTAWSNSVRSRLYLTAEGDAKSNRRILSLEKTNYGPPGGELAIHWQNGVYVLDSESDPVIDGLIHATEDALFLELLALFTEQGQNVTATKGTAYAPAKMAKHPKAKGYTNKKLADAMQRLLDAKRIKIETDGPPSRQRSRLVAVE
jgi:RecA-family ATPase